MKVNQKNRKYLRFIESYWKKCVVKLKKDQGTAIALPHPFISSFPERLKYWTFYWDNYFVILGLVVSKKIKLAKGIIENFAYLFRRFGLVPEVNAYNKLSVSQIPFLTSMILEVFSITQDKKWLKDMSTVAEGELKEYWMNGIQRRPHLIYQGLSRYTDYYGSDLVAEHESGWDFSSRFDGKATEFLPIDLNCCLYKYEWDLSEIYKVLGNHSKSRNFKAQALLRKNKINRLMWNEQKGFYFDFNYRKKKQSQFWSVAGFFALWSGLANAKQSQKIRKNLRIFEHGYGVANSKKIINHHPEIKQWDYPNGWAPMHWIIIKGLERYGFNKDAKRITDKWLGLNKKIFDQTGWFWEKYDVVSGKIGNHEGRFKKTDRGFAWTNAVFLRLIQP